MRRDDDLSWRNEIRFEVQQGVRVPYHLVACVVLVFSIF